MTSIIVLAILLPTIFIAARVRYGKNPKTIKELQAQGYRKGHYNEWISPEGKTKDVDNDIYLAKTKLSLLSLLVVPMVMIPACTANVGANTTGIVFDSMNGGIQDKTMGEGLNFKSPFQKVITISSATQTKNFTLAAQTGIDKDCTATAGKTCGGGQFVTYELTLNYNISKSDAGLFYKTFGVTEVPETFLNGKLREAMQHASTQFDVFAILKGKLTDVRALGETYLAAELAKANINLSGFTITDVDAGKEIEAIIVKEAQAEKQKEIAQKEAEAALITANNKVAIAKAEAEAAAAKAEGEAEVAKIKAEAEAKVKVLISNTLAVSYGFATWTNEEMTAVEFIEYNGDNGKHSREQYAKLQQYLSYLGAWDGKLPEIVVGDSGLISIIIPGLDKPTTTA